MRDWGDIRALVLRAWTGNRSHDLMGFVPGDEFEYADKCWHEEASRRFETADRAKRMTDRTN